MRRKDLFSAMPLLILISSMAMVHTASPIIAEIALSVEPQFLIDPTLVAGETFTVDIMVTDPTDAMNLYGFDIKVGYDTSVLTATSIAMGDFFPPNSWILKQKINDTAGADPVDKGGDPTMGYAWYAATLPFGTLYGLNGTGTLFTVTFTVDALGDTPLHLYGGDPSSTEPYTVYLLDPYSEEISRTVVDGYFRNAEFLYLADLVRKSAWPDHHHHVTSKHGNINILHARFGNKGPRPVTVYVRFTVYNSTGSLLGTIDTDTYNLALGEIPADLTADFDITDPTWEYTYPITKYNVKAELFYLDFDVGQWYEGSKDKWFSFAILGSFAPV